MYACVQDLAFFYIYVLYIRLETLLVMSAKFDTKNTGGLFHRHTKFILLTVSNVSLFSKQLRDLTFYICTVYC
jgi:hypothetical protein